MANQTSAERCARRRRRLKGLGLCSNCGQKGERGTKLCNKCLLRKLATSHLGTAKRWQELRDLLVRQQFKCAYTNRPIDVGINASVEHVIPVSRDPSLAKSITNIRWVHTSINRMKNDMTLPELLSNCREILNFFGFEVKRNGE